MRAHFWRQSLARQTPLRARTAPRCGSRPPCASFRAPGSQHVCCEMMVSVHTLCPALPTRAAFLPVRPPSLRAIAQRPDLPWTVQSHSVSRSRLPAALIWPVRAQSYEHHSRALVSESRDSPALERLPRRRKLAELVPDHLSSDAQRDVLLPVVHEEAHPARAPRQVSSSFAERARGGRGGRTQ